LIIHNKQGLYIPACGWIQTLKFKWQEAGDNYTGTMRSFEIVTLH